MRVSVVVPALNEQETVGAVVEALRAQNPLEVLVIDADSADTTAAEAARAGARVLNWREILPEIVPVQGKGESLWRGVAAARGDIVVFVDADLEVVPEGIVDKLSAPLADAHVHLVKADYQRSFRGAPTGGGRVTELTAKPLLRQFFPSLADVNQPLAGEYALRRSTAVQLPFVHGYGVEAGLLIDVAKKHGREAVAQVYVGERVHRNRPLEELAPMADLVASTILARAGVVSSIAQRPPLISVATEEDWSV